MKRFGLVLFLIVFLFSTREIFAAGCYDGICSDADYLLDCVEGDCYAGASCDIAKCPQPPPDNVCCRPGVKCPEGKPVWTWAHDAKCKVVNVDPLGYGCTWEWQFEYCGAGDYCSPCSNGGGAEAICAGVCASSGCVKGGWYKTCCQLSGAATVGTRLSGATGTCSDRGGCSSGARVRWADFRSSGSFLQQHSLFTVLGWLELDC